VLKGFLGGRAGVEVFGSDPDWVCALIAELGAGSW
jgi:hypothetical protein